MDIAHTRKSGRGGELWVTTDMEPKTMPVEDICPQCRKPVIHTEGCVKCTECTWSACKL